MMKRLIVAAATLIGAVTGAAAADAVTVATVNLRAGPSTGYPVVSVVPGATRIVTHGCLVGYTWCDVEVGPWRGWIAARYIEIVRQGVPVVMTPAVAAGVGVAVVTYSRAYWDRYYVGQPWYGRWVARPLPPAPADRGARVTSHARSVDCADGSCTGTRSTTGVWGGSTAQTRTCADGSCTATRETAGPRGNTASRTRSCSRADASCSATRTGPRGGTAERSVRFHR